jgi:enoyl-CoA hydratase
LLRVARARLIEAQEENPLAYQTLTYRRDDRVAIITLNRPERLNAITRGMPDEIRAAVEEANRDDLVHVVLLQGAGRAFCAGYDLKNAAEQPRGTARCARLRGRR